MTQAIVIIVGLTALVGALTGLQKAKTDDTKEKKKLTVGEAETECEKRAIQAAEAATSSSLFGGADWNSRNDDAEYDRAYRKEYNRCMKKQGY